MPPSSRWRRRAERWPEQCEVQCWLPESLLIPQVRAIDGVSQAGSVVRKWHGLMSAMGQADHYDIHFPLDLDVKMKAMIFGACFLIVSLLLSSCLERIILPDKKQVAERQ